MVCLAEEETIQAIITDTIATGPKRQSSINLTPSKAVNLIFNEVALDFHYPEDGFELCIQDGNGDVIILNQHKGRTLGDIGVKFGENVRHKLIINSFKRRVPLRINQSKTRRNDIYFDFYGLPNSKDNDSCEMDVKVTESYNYVGLVNQAMTCYLNSLLQALYMTPEFRNALYNWEFDGVNETRSIPFQLQKLFLNLQTSTKSAVETTDLTTSFGWQGSEAWQQHDIQELCRVMFDALEQKFKCTKQANLINDLYEGKMLDYVKCLECSTEKSREDTFLDIPLPVRPFGSDVAYNSVEEALRAFVQPETLDGNNQYHCEKCNKKCDAHKGLKFTKFPYLLTLHLKRFDFDYNTMHRIKLNDKVVFPQILNLNSFIFPSGASSSSDQEVVEERETVVKCDDSSTTSDSGSALDDESCHGAENLPSFNSQDDACHDEDEGIDMSEVKGPYVYELFSIMIHSGSASGGHYYAYIKDFQRNQWFCFNDMNVSRITEEDIKKTYGGGPQRGYYSSAYSSSTNAYMLMYRQIDKERNCNAMSVEGFPPHIQKLLQQMKEKEECDRISKEKENDLIKLKVYCEHPVQNQMLYTKLAVYIDSPLEDAVKDAFSCFKLEGLVPLEDCRLVSYNKVQDYIDCSFERDNLRFCDIANRINIHQNDWLLEIKQPGTQFQTYKPGGVNMKVFVINLETEEVDGPTNVRVNAGETVGEFKAHLAFILNMDVNTIKVVKETYSNEPQLLEDDDVPMKFDPSFNGYKIYVSNAMDEDSEKQFIFSKLHRVIDHFVHIISINVVLPDTNLSTLESLSIPPLDLNQNLEKNELVTDRLNSSPNLRVSPQPGVLCGEGFGDQSNSEDSSLSDSDRTLVGDAPGDCLGLLSSSSNSPADQHMASPSDPAEDTYNHEVFGNPAEEMNWENEPEPLQRCMNYYFRATTCVNNSDSYADAEVARYCKVLVDKRMTLCKFKKHLEPIVGVPVDYFKIYRQYPNQDDEWSRLKDTLGTAKDGERLIVKLGRVLKKDEYSGKVYHFTPNGTETFNLLFEHIIAKGQTVGAVKREIIIQAKKQHMLDIPFYKSRLRKKSWKNPSKIYLDDQKFVEDVNLNNNFELFIQELEDIEKLTSPKQLALFVRHWSPSTLTLSPFSEIVLDTPTMDELKRRISEKSDIPQPFVEVVCLKSSFPCDVNVLEIHSDLDWNPNVPLLESWPLQIYEDGSVFFYRDSREQLKELSQEEKKELNQKENTRLGRYSSKTYSPGRERALKIYLDTSPSKPKDNTVD